jgi:hypothetical protein
MLSTCPGVPAAETAKKAEIRDPVLKMILPDRRGNSQFRN